MKCLHLLGCLTLALIISAPAEAGGSYGSYGSYGSSGGSSGGYVHGSSGGGLLSGLRARLAARHSGSSGGASSGGSIGGSSGGSVGGSSGGSSGGYVAAYASAGSSGGSSGGGGLFSRLRARIAAKHAAHASSGGSAGGSSGGSSGGYSTGYVAAHSGYSSGGASYGGASYGGGSSGGYVAPVSYAAPLSYESPMMHLGYPTESYPSGVMMESPGYPTEAPMIDGGVPNSTGSGNSVIDGAVIDSGASYESRKPALDDDAALLTVAVPAESARVTVNGHETSSDGMVRQFMSRGLKDGYLYTYEVVVTYDVDGTEQRDTKTIKLRPGDMERLVFQQNASNAADTSDVEAAVEDTDAELENAEVKANAKQDTTETVVQLHVPANAVVTLAGNETSGYGRVRTFRTTQLAAGQAWDNYTIVVSAKVNGRDIRNERTIHVDAGSTVELEFDFDAATLAMR